MRCQQARLLMQELVDGRLSSGMPAQFDEHLSACPACQSEFAGLRRVVFLLDRMPVIMATHDFAARVMHGLRARREAHYCPRAEIRAVMRSVAALAVIILVIVVGVVQFNAIPALGTYIQTWQRLPSTMVEATPHTATISSNASLFDVLLFGASPSGDLAFLALAGGVILILNLGVLFYLLKPRTDTQAQAGDYVQ